MRKREMEGGVQFDSFLSSSFIQVVSVRLYSSKLWLIYSVIPFE